MAYVNLGQIMYPVGAIYASVNSTSPATLFGGAWSQITDAALRGATSVGYVGSDTHTLTINEMPSHNHPLTDILGCGWEINNIESDRLAYARYNRGRTLGQFGQPSSQGGGAAHTNVQRSYNCYMWQRTS